MKQKNKIGVVMKWKNKKYVQWQKNCGGCSWQGISYEEQLKKSKSRSKNFEKYLSGRTDYWYEKSISL